MINERITLVMRDSAVKDKLRDTRLGWCRHIMRKGKCQITRQAVELVVEETASRWRLKLRWSGKIKKNLKEASV